MFFYQVGKDEFDVSKICRSIASMADMRGEDKEIPVGILDNGDLYYTKGRRMYLKNVECGVSMQNMMCTAFVTVTINQSMFQ